MKMTNEMGTRAAVIAALMGIGHTDFAADQVLRRAEELADIAAFEEDAGGKLNAENQAAADDFQRWLPAVWAFACAGYHGGGGIPDHVGDSGDHVTDETGARQDSAAEDWRDRPDSGRDGLRPLACAGRDSAACG